MPEGKLRNLEEAIRLNPPDGTYGIGHTRWVTHGTHQLKKMLIRIEIVRAKLSWFTNGIIENYLPPERNVDGNGHTFKTETDTRNCRSFNRRHHCQRRFAIWKAGRKLSSNFCGILFCQSFRLMHLTQLLRSDERPPVVIGLGDGEFCGIRYSMILQHTRAMFFISAKKKLQLTKDSLLELRILTETRLNRNSNA